MAFVIYTILQMCKFNVNFMFTAGTIFLLQTADSADYLEAQRYRGKVMFFPTFLLVVD